MIETMEPTKAFIWFAIPLLLGAGGYIFRDEIMNLIKGGFGEKVAGKKIGILGLPQSGKTRLTYFLKEKEFPKEVNQTMANKDYDVNKDISVRLADLNIDVITDSRSHQGESDYKKEEEILTNCDIILYLFNASKCFNDPEGKDSKKYFKTGIKKEINTYLDIIKIMEKKEKELSIKKSRIFLLIGTHRDMIKGAIDKESESKIVSLLDAFSESEFCIAEYLGLHSLLYPADADRLEIEMFKTLKRIIG